MPREKINDEMVQGFYTEVSWRRQPQTAEDAAETGGAPGHVQIASVNALSPFSFPDIDTGDHFEAGEKFDGWRVTLDEAGIDRLIKALHKAKRQAFGGECGQAPCDHAPDGGNHPDAVRVGPLTDVSGEQIEPLPNIAPPSSWRVIGDDNIRRAERGAFIPGPDGGQWV